MKQIFGLKNWVVLFLTSTALIACSKAKDAPELGNGQIPTAEIFPITNSKFVNCRFAQPTPTYAFNSKIADNVIRCDEGVPKKIQVISQNPLPNGLELDSEKLALVGTAKEKVVSAPFVVYLENEAGYVRIPLTITIR